jgi:hypothetical protein
MLTEDMKEPDQLKDLELDSLEELAPLCEMGLDQACLTALS